MDAGSQVHSLHHIKELWVLSRKGTALTPEKFLVTVMKKKISKSSSNI
jgi:hypothetical protein